MSDDLSNLTKDVGSELAKLAGATAEALVEDAGDILEKSIESGPRAKELAEEALAWQSQAIQAVDEELKARYEHEYDVARAAVATKLIDEKRVANTAARDAFMVRFDAFKEAALAIGKVALKTGGKIALNNVTAGIGGPIAGSIIDKL